MKQFDAAKAHQLIKDTISLTRSQCPEGAIEWLEDNRPDLAQCLDDAGAAINEAFDREDSLSLSLGLKAWSEKHYLAFGIFNCRPPVINMQKVTHDADPWRANGNHD